MENDIKINLLDVKKYIGESFYLSETFHLFWWKRTVTIKCKKDRCVFCVIDKVNKEVRTLRYTLCREKTGPWCMTILTDSKTGETLTKTKSLYSAYSALPSEHKYGRFPLVVDCNGTSFKNCKHVPLSEVIISDNAYIFVHTTQLLWGFLNARKKISIINTNGEELISRHYDESFFTIHKDDVNIELLAVLFYCGYNNSILSTGC